MADNNFVYHIKVVGEDTEIERVGRFVGKLRIPWRDQLRQDEIRRSLLGDKPNEASVRVANMADVVSFLKLHLTESPDWWTNELQDGMNCEDDNVVVAIYEGLSKEIERLREDKKKRAEAAKGDLKAIVEARKG